MNANNAAPKDRFPLAAQAKLAWSRLTGGRSKKPAEAASSVEADQTVCLRWVARPTIDGSGGPESLKLVRFGPPLTPMTDETDFSATLQASRTSADSLPASGQLGGMANHSSVTRQIVDIARFAGQRSGPLSNALARPNMISYDGDGRMGGGKGIDGKGGWFLLPADAEQAADGNLPDRLDAVPYAVSALVASGSFSQVYIAQEKGGAAQGQRAGAFGSSSPVHWALRRTTLLPAQEQDYATRLGRGISDLTNVTYEDQAMAAADSPFYPQAFFVDLKDWDREHNVAKAFWSLSRYAPGDLKSLRPSEVIGKRQMTAWLMQLAISLSGQLSVLHGQEVAHYDIKPANTLVDPSLPQLFYLGDFGLAVAYDDEPIAGFWRGTEAYMAPEVLHSDRERTIGPAADAFSLGLLLFDVATFSRRLAVARSDPTAESPGLQSEQIERAAAAIGLPPRAGSKADHGAMPVWAPYAMTNENNFANAHSSLLTAESSKQLGEKAPSGESVSVVAEGLRWLDQELPAAAHLLRPLLGRDRLQQPPKQLMLNFKAYAEGLARQENFLLEADAKGATAAGHQGPTLDALVRADLDTLLTSKPTGSNALRRDRLAQVDNMPMWTDDLLPGE